MDRRDLRAERREESPGEILLFQAELGVGGIARPECLQCLVGRDYGAKHHVAESEAIERGMQEKAEEFKKTGGEIYTKA